jgi:hypothetical protein
VADEIAEHGANFVRIVERVKRLRTGVIAIARLTLATMAADSGVLLGISLVPSSSDIHYFLGLLVSARFGARGRHRD